MKLEPAQGAKFGYVTVLSGKAKSKKSRNVPLSERVVKMFGQQWAGREEAFSPGGWIAVAEQAISVSSILQRVRTLPKMPSDFVLHSLRHSFGTRLGESGADAFTIMRLMGHSTVTVSQRYVHPSPEALDGV